MKRTLLLGAVLAGAVIAARHVLSSKEGESIRQRMMIRMMDGMPENSPPKLVVSILPRLQEQNDEILALLRAQMQSSGGGN